MELPIGQVICDNYNTKIITKNMSIFDSIILGTIQGLTEFLPISSSGHLIIARDLFGWHGSSDLSFDAILQLATGIALVVYFRKDIWRLIKTFFAMISKKTVEQKDKIMIWAIIIGTIPAVILGLFLQKYMETIFRSAILVSFVLIIGSVVMYLAEKFSKKDRQLSVWKGIGIGFFQCLSLVPGFSRSGATISGGLLFGLNREDAARFSFLLSIPIILGSGIKQLLSVVKSGTFSNDWLNIFSGSITSFIFGIIAIIFLMKFLKNNSLKVFIWYRVILAVVVLIILL
ncbi:MAG: undecaprenyl-diphosphatase UppP [Candidatus Taylorbacteria bacterium]|nr:undecaprenyl-diphosphatase UppP [Candidatus Taylorbacteria bacterium]